MENNSYPNSEDPDQVAAEQAAARTASNTPTTQSEDPDLVRQKELEQEAQDKETDEH